MVKYLAEQIEHLQRQHNPHLNIGNATNNTNAVAPRKWPMEMLEEENTSHSRERQNSQRTNRTANMYYLGVHKDTRYKPSDHQLDALFMEKIHQLEQRIQMNEENNPRSSNN